VEGAVARCGGEAECGVRGRQLTAPLTWPSRPLARRGASPVPMLHAAHLATPAGSRGESRISWNLLRPPPNWSSTLSARSPHQLDLVEGGKQMSHRWPHLAMADESRTNLERDEKCRGW
jgi:hypothetical protein